VQITLVQASLSTAHDLMKTMQDDAGTHVRRTDLEKALSDAMSLMSSVGASVVCLCGTPRH
jgi:hypothetical protein